LRWRDAEARRSDRPKNWVLDNELAVQLSRRPFDAFAAFNAALEANPKSPRRARKELFELLSAPLDEAEARLPLNRAPEAADKQRLRSLQDAVAALAASLEIPESLLCARRHLEVLLAGQGWPERCRAGAAACWSRRWRRCCHEGAGERLRARGGGQRRGRLRLCSGTALPVPATSPPCAASTRRK
jgi:ribonuclease D